MRSMRDSATARELGIQGLGWVVRRYVERPADVAPFYKNTFGMDSFRRFYSSALVQSPTQSQMLWAGDLVMLEINALAVGVGTEARLHDVALLLRSPPPADAILRVKAAGGTVVATAKESSFTTVADPWGRLIGLVHGGLAATHARPAGAAVDGTRPAEIPGAQPSAARFQDLYGIQVRVADVEAMAEFYARMLGLSILTSLDRPASAGVDLGLGRRAVLRILPGGHLHTVPPDRDQVPDAWVLRVFDHAGLTERLEEAKVPIVNVRRFTGGVITYASDPEGRLFGYQQRTPDLLLPGDVERREDAVANALWLRGE